MALLLTWSGLLAATLAPLPLLQVAVLLGVGAATTLLLGVLRRESWPALLAALCCVAAGGLFALDAGLPTGFRPLVFLFPTACWLLAWSLLRRWRSGGTGPWLLAGAWLAWTALFLHAWQPVVPPGARLVAAGLGLAALAGGLALRRPGLSLLGVGSLLAELLLASTRSLGSGVIPGATLLAAVGTVGLLATVAAWRSSGRSLTSLFGSTGSEGTEPAPPETGSDVSAS